MFYSTTARIRGFIRQVKRKGLFTTRDCLRFGSRGAVDQALYMLVKQKIIIRVARGVFSRPDAPTPSAFLVAKTKAEAFGKRILQDGRDTGQKLEFPVEANDTPTFATSGRSSSFKVGDTVIRFKGLSPRKMIRHAHGRVVRAMWATGKEKCTPEIIDKTYPNWGRAFWRLHAEAPLLPDWMNSLFVWGRAAKRKPKEPTSFQYGWSL